MLSSQGITVELFVKDDVYWEFDEDLISGVIGNALNNAIRYTQDRISLIAQENDGFLELRIEDNGTGYPQKILDAGAEAMRGVDFLSGSTRSWPAFFGGGGWNATAIVAEQARYCLKTAAL